MPCLRPHHRLARLLGYPARAWIFVALLALSLTPLHAEGWVSPTTAVDPSGGTVWATGPLAIDGNTATYARNLAGAVGWRGYLECSFGATIHTAQVRVTSDFGYGFVDMVDVDLKVAGTWTNVFEGTVTDAAPTIVTFPAVDATDIRYRFHYLANGASWEFWLYEIAAYNSTASAPATVATQPATSVWDNSAVPHASILNAQGGPCQVRFDYGTTAAYGSLTPWAGALATGETGGAVIAGLASNTQYHYRAQVLNGTGIIGYGSDATFTTGTTVNGTWMSPNGVIPLGWTLTDGAIDDESATSARFQHASGAAQWSDYITFTNPNVIARGMQLIAEKEANVDEIDVDAFINGAWVVLYDGNFTDGALQTYMFAAGWVTQSRVRLHVNATNFGFYWNLAQVQLLCDPTATTTTSLTSSSNPSTFGAAVTFHATVTATGATPTGTVTFLDNGTAIGAGALNGSGVATLAISTLNSGAASPHPITAKYLGSAGFTTSSSSSLSQVVNPASTSTALASSGNPANVGVSVTFTATVTSVGGTPSGTVDFKDGASTIASGVVLNGSGVATFATSALAGGSHSITAVYAASTNYLTSTSPIVSQVINNPPTDIALSASTVAENAASGTTVGTLSSTDPDAGNTFTYTLVAGAGSADNASFTISVATLKTAAVFDFEAKSSYSIRVRTTDQGGAFFEEALTITVTNVNETPTNIALSPSSVAENQASGTPVGTLSTTDPDAGNTFTYTLVSGAGSTNNSSFTISGATLKTAAVFNFETKSSYSIRVRTSDQGGLLVEKALAITITNVNETPTSLALSVSTIAENQASGTTVGTLSSTDPDAGDTFTYTLVAGVGSTDNASFAIAGPLLQSAAMFDFETKSSYAIRIRTTDAGGLFFEKALTVTVTNANDAPTNISLSSSTVAENSASGTTIGTLSSTDQDVGDTFTYALVAGAGSTDNALFSITAATLKTAAVLDFETKPSCSIRVRTTDAAGAFFEKVLTVTVTNVNETPTDIALAPSSVAEKSAIGTVVGTLSSTDVDAGNTFTYTLVAGTGSTDNASFTIAAASLKTNAVFDFETKSSYAIRVRTTDQGGLFVEKALTVTVTNVDETPTNLVLSASTIAENQASGTTVGTLSSTDPDVGDTFTYTLVAGSGSTDNASFAIAGSSLQSAEVFDFETKSSYAIRVRTTDSGGLFFEKALTVTVTNVNDAPTDIALTPGMVAENAASGTTVGTLSSTDQDAGDTFTYTLVAGVGSTDNASFSITAATLKTAAVFDFETKPSCAIRVRTTDATGAFFEEALTVTVANVNETPTDIALTSNSVAENSASGTTVGTFSSTDPDVGDTFTYTLVAGAGSADNGSFTIVAGALKTAAVFDFETKSSYAIRVRTTDAGGLLVEKALTVSVTNVDEAPTDIALSATTVAENSAIGTTVGMLSSTDPDVGDTFTYALVAGIGSTDNGSFAIAGSSLQTAAALDFETKSSYAIRVRTTDAGGLLFEKAVTITVTNVNETPTDIALSATTVAENSASGTAVGTLSCTDVDAGNTFTYTLVAGAGSTDNASFAVAGASLNTAAVFDYETKSSYAIRVRTTDQGGLFFEKALTVTVTNVNEAPTNIALSSTTIAENSAIGSMVGTLSTTDVDAGNTFTYALTGGLADNAAFSITANTLKTAAALDFETKNSYSIQITSTDQGGLSVVKAFTITITDVNEAPTNIALSSTTIAENSAIGSTVGTLSTTDVDAGNTFTYALTGGLADNAAFSITANALKTAAALDFETKSSYSIQITSTDQGGLSVVKAFTITITNVNEAPTNIALSSTTIAENSAIGSTVGTMSTTDVDAGNTFTYALTGGLADNAAFSITANTLKTAAALDFETKNSYSIQITSTDQGGLSVVKAFTITITDVNEAPTNIALSSTTIAENSAIGSTVGTLSTTDVDAGNTFTYALTGGLADNAAFSITANTLKTAAALDFETKNSYSIQITSTDQGGLSVVKAFTITITDVNEAPTNIALSSTTIAENSAIGSTVGTMSTTDVDAGNTFTYALTGGLADNAAFSITANTLKTAAALDFETKNSYSIQITSTDQGGLTVVKAFTITITDVNEAPTNIALSSTTIAENTAIGSTVGTLSTTDVDAGNTFTYALTGGLAGNAAFTIAGSLLKTAAAIDFETKSSYSIQVTSTDQGGLTTVKAFTISVTNVNEAPIVVGPAANSTNEDTATVFSAGSGTLISVSDPDAGLATVRADVTATGGVVTLSTLTGLTVIGGANGTSSVSVTGSIAAIDAALDGAGFAPAANSNGIAVLTVVVDDLGNSGSGTAQSGSLSIPITIVPVNDVPSFTKGADQTSANDTTQHTISGWATGISAGPADELAQALDFIVSNDQPGLFSAAPAVAADGTLTFTAAAEVNGVATVTVRLHDDGGVLNGGQDTSAAQTFTISITSVDDPPIIVSPSGQTTYADQSLAINGLSVSDVDTGSLQVSLSVAHGSLGLGTTSGLTFTLGTGSGDAAMVFSGPIASLNTALATLSYTPDPVYAGADPISITVADQTTTVPGSIPVTVVSSLMRGLLAEYRLDDLSGTVAVDSVGLHPGVVRGSRWSTSGAGALEFNGVDNYVAIPSAADMDISGLITLSSWVNVGSTTGEREIIIHGFVDNTTNPSCAGVMLRVYNGHFEVGSWGGPTVPTATGRVASYAIPPGDVGSWVLLTGVYDGATWRLYRNGTEVATTASGVGALPMAAGWALGSRCFGNERFYDGFMSDARIYDRALTPAEASRLFAVGHGNTGPVVSAGYDRHAGGSSIVDLYGNVRDDHQPNASPTSSWTVVSGPGSVTFANAAVPQTSATFTVPGAYVLRLSASDGALTTSDDIAVTVGSGIGFGMVGQWRLDEAGGGIAADSSGSGHPGSLVGGVVWAGGTGGGAVFDGRTSSIDLGNPDDLQFLGRITMSAWIAPDVTDGINDILVHGFQLAPNAQVFLRISAGFYQVGRWNGTNYMATAAVPATDRGKWVHLAGTYDGASWRLYRNGVQIASAVDAVGAVRVSSPSLPAAGSAWAIGARGLGTEDYFRGFISDVRLYDRELAPAEITALAALTPVGNRAPVVDAGADFTAPQSPFVALPGRIMDDGLATPVVASWTVVSAPGGASVTFENAANAATRATFSATGSYVLRLTATDGGNSVSDDINATIVAPGLSTIGMVARWRFNEGAGTTAFDSTANHFDAKILGAAWQASGPDNLSSLLFDLHSRLYVDGAEEMGIAGTVTLSAWIKPASFAGAAQTIVTHGYTQSPRPQAEVFLRISQGKYQVGTWNGVDHVASFTAPATDLNTWVHLTGTYDGAYWRLYRNGVQAAQTLETRGPMPVQSSSWGIGGSGNNGDRFFNGSIDDVRVYNRAVTPDEAVLLTMPIGGG